MRRATTLILCVGIAAAGCSRHAREPDPAELVGAWRAAVDFDAGPFAALDDLEFLYVFNAGGTMTESSNYDGAPPVPPAYGAWARVGPGEFVATYEFFVCKPLAQIEDLATNGGWLPDGRGRFEERIRVAADGSSFDSTFRYSPLKADGSSAGEVVGGKTHGVRIVPQHH